MKPKTEIELIEMAIDIKNELGLTLETLAIELEQHFGRVYSQQYIGQSLNPFHKETNGTKIAVGIIEHFTGAKIKKDRKGKPLQFFALEESAV